MTDSLPAVSVAKLLGICPGALYARIKTGKFPPPDMKTRGKNGFAWRLETVIEWLKCGIRYGRGDWSYGWITQAEGY